MDEATGSGRAEWAARPLVIREMLGFARWILGTWPHTTRALLFMIVLLGAPVLVVWGLASGEGTLSVGAAALVAGSVCVTVARSRRARSIEQGRPPSIDPPGAAGGEPVDTPTA